MNLDKFNTGEFPIGGLALPQVAVLMSTQAKRKLADAFPNGILEVRGRSESNTTLINVYNGISILHDTPVVVLTALNKGSKGKLIIAGITPSEAQTFMKQHNTLGAHAWKPYAADGSDETSIDIPKCNYDDAQTAGEWMAALGKLRPADKSPVGIARTAVIKEYSHLKPPLDKIAAAGALQDCYENCRPKKAAQREFIKALGNQN